MSYLSLSVCTCKIRSPRVLKAFPAEVNISLTWRKQECIKQWRELKIFYLPLHSLWTTVELSFLWNLKVVKRGSKDVFWQKQTNCKSGRLSLNLQPYFDSKHCLAPFSCSSIAFFALLIWTWSCCWSWQKTAKIESESKLSPSPARIC